MSHYDDCIHDPIFRDPLPGRFEPIRAMYLQARGRMPAATDIGHGYYGMRYEGKTLNQLKTEWTEGGEPDPPPVQPPVGDGMALPGANPTGSYLYGDEGNRRYWLAASRIIGNQWDVTTLSDYLTTPEQRAATHVVVACSTGLRPDMKEVPFDCLGSATNEQLTVRQLNRILATGKQPLVYCMTQEFFIQQLGRDFDRLIDQIRNTVKLVAPYCKVVVPFREIGDIYGGGDLEKRTEIFKTIARNGLSHTIPACHERGLTEIPVSDFHETDRPCMSLCQCKFSTPTGGLGRPQDEVTKGSHTYDGAAGFVESNGRRMAGYVGSQIAGHYNVAFEHSIPDVFDGQQWQPTRTWSSARTRAEQIADYCDQQERRRGVLPGTYYRSDMSAGVLGLEA